MGSASRYATWLVLQNREMPDAEQADTTNVAANAEERRIGASRASGEGRAFSLAVDTGSTATRSLGGHIHRGSVADLHGEHVALSGARCKTLFLIPTLGGGGAERVVCTLLRHIDQARFALTLGVVDSRDAVFRRDVPDHVEYVDLAAGRVRYALPRLLKLIWSIRPDVVFSTLGHLNLALALSKPLLPRRTRLIGRETIVLSQALASESRRALWSFGYRWFYRRLDRIVCQSRDMRDDLIREFAVPEEKAVVIPNPIDAEAIRRRACEALPEAAADWVRPSAGLRLVAAGRLTFQKGFDLLLDAVASCRDLPVRVAILGDGPLRNDLLARARQLGIDERVDFVGYQQNPYPWFRAADAFVVSSRYEGLSNVMLEALACGTPVIATPAPGGTRDVLSAISECEIADSISSSSLASAIRVWAKRQRRRVPDDAVAAYSVERVTRRYEQEILAVAGVAGP